MLSVKSGSLPDKGLLQIYAKQEGCFTDCFYTDVPQKVSLEEMIATFFATPAFRLERKLLALFASRSSTHKDVENLATGASDTLAVWKVEAREPDQILMIAGNGHVRTWLMVEFLVDNKSGTRLYFGSAVLPKESAKTGELKMDPLFHVLSGFHKLYSQILLGLTRQKFLQKFP